MVDSNTRQLADCLGVCVGGIAEGLLDQGFLNVGVDI